jgi:AcrR family transcriptional regulator
MEMRENHIAAARPRGRPQIRSDEETRQLIIEAAGRIFRAKGYASTCIGEIAQEAGVSTKTLYRLVPTKAELFTNVVSERIGQFMLDIDEGGIDGLDLTGALERILVLYGNLTLDPEVIAVNRLVIGESDRFPEIATAFYDLAIARTTAAMADWLAKQCTRGLIKLDDPEEAAGMLRGMMTMEPQRAAMLNQRAAPGRDEIAARAKRAAHLFLNGCRV